LLTVSALTVSGTVGARVSEQLTVRVADRVGVPAAVLCRATDRVVTLFRQVDVQVTIQVAGRDRRGTRETDRASRNVLGLAMLVVLVSAPAAAQLLGSLRAGRAGLHDVSIGFTPSDAAGGGQLAYVVWEAVERVGQESGVDPALVLAIAIAHEIGHLLLPAGHSGKGLMRERSGPTDWKLATMGRLGFGATEGELIRRRLRSSVPESTVRP
jgi:hypothetical protein